MASENGVKTITDVVANFPTSQIPSIYADTVVSAARDIGGLNTMKFYFLRVDPNPSGSGPVSPVPCLQVVMPVTGFAHMVVFLNDQLEKLIQRGTLNREFVDGLKSDLVSEPK